MNSKKKTYTAVIIGAGKIASGYDTPKLKHVLTHAHALSLNPRVDLLGIADIDIVRGKREAAKWSAAFFGDYKKMLHELKPDIVVIATPDHTHKKILIDVLVHKPKVVIAEKPIVNEKSDIAHVRRVATKAGVPVVVNFRRRFDAAVSEIRDSLVRGKYGGILSANALYTKGILHNGSHMIDLARYLFGEMVLAKMSFSVNDFPEGEPSLGGVATFERCPQFYLMTGDERSFYAFELEIITSRA